VLNAHLPGLTPIPLSLKKVSTSLSMSGASTSLSENMTRSSANAMAAQWEFELTFSRSSSTTMLNSIGLRGSPCLTQRKVRRGLVCSFPTLMVIGRQFSALVGSPPLGMRIVLVSLHTVGSTPLNNKTLKKMASVKSSEALTAATETLSRPAAEWLQPVLASHTSSSVMGWRLSLRSTIFASKGASSAGDGDS
jgi:hypothetical protein